MYNTDICLISRGINWLFLELRLVEECLIRDLICWTDDDDYCEHTVSRIKQQESYLFIHFQEMWNMEAKMIAT